MQNEHSNSKREKCETIVESLCKEFSLRHKEELKKEKASISESYNAKNSYYSGAYIMAIVNAEIDYIRRLMDYILGKIEADFSNIPLSDFKETFGTIISQEYDEAIPPLEDFAKRVSRGSHIRGFIAPIKGAKQNSMEILEARSKLDNVKTAVKGNTVFISHAQEDASVAEIVKTQIDKVFGSRLEVFVSSIPGAIPPGSDWFDNIIMNLITADAFIVLVTHTSISRHFVWFEIGLSWLRRRNQNCKMYALCLSPIMPGDLREPLCRLQATLLGEEKQTEAFFTELINQFSFGNLNALDFTEIRDSLPTCAPQAG
jgi:hypothetical protein